jgi:hypothetical protein
MTKFQPEMKVNLNLDEKNKNFGWFEFIRFWFATLCFALVDAYSSLIFAWSQSGHGTVVAVVGFWSCSVLCYLDDDITHTGSPRSYSYRVNTAVKPSVTIKRVVKLKTFKCDYRSGCYVIVTMTQPMMMMTIIILHLQFHPNHRSSIGYSQLCNVY